MGNSVSPTVVSRQVKTNLFDPFMTFVSKKKGILVPRLATLVPCDLTFSLISSCHTISLNTTRCTRSILLDGAPKRGFSRFARGRNYDFLGTVAVENRLSTTDSKFDNIHFCGHRAVRILVTPRDGSCRVYDHACVGCPILLDERYACSLDSTCGGLFLCLGGSFFLGAESSSHFCLPVLFVALRLSYVE